MFGILVQNQFSRFKVNDCSYLEPETRWQSLSERWRQERALRISSSVFKEIACRRSSTPCSKLVKRVVYRNNVSTLAMKYALVNEGNALKQYEENHCIQVQSCGLFVHPNKPFLCSSPDGLIGDDGVLEIKRPYSGRFSKNLAEFITDGKNKFVLKILNKGEIFTFPKATNFITKSRGNCLFQTENGANYMCGVKRIHLCCGYTEMNNFGQICFQS
ncbi:hypothetical protein AVEN_69359-1 [Araneus ventricosus]|uniref:YqaJ viral recombinase domain-containing protein n=1 Tax=Araneus ventricosus TaxID=182803 RepID=A0A4Y2JYH3_ARAVE|nr:hypothetical protein AVEN_69359-1 [Araneus ventricosus]